MISVVIIAKNEADNIGDCIRSAKLISNDIIVIDTGSIDQTIMLAKQEAAKVFKCSWEGYGSSKNYGAAQAKNNWIFSLDADERITPDLARSIREINFGKTNRVYKCKRENFFHLKKIRFGAAGNDKVVRLYHKTCIQWDQTTVHEKLAGNYTTRKIKGSLIHYSIPNLKDYRQKAIDYASLSAHKYFEQNRKAGFTKRFIAPLFNFFKSYFLQLGFLEGSVGFYLAQLTAYYTWLKYHHLHQLYIQEKESKKNMHQLLANSTIVFAKK